MGTLRLLLAVAVSVGHTPWWLTQASGPYPLQASYAVQCFFVLSGFYMALTWQRKYAALPSPRWTFWRSRAARLYPAYWLVVVVTLVAAPLVPGVPVALWFSELCSPLQSSDYLVLGLVGLTNVFMLGQEFMGFMTMCQGSQLIGAIVPQGWSLGMEMAFYLLLPWLIRVRTVRLIALVLVIALARIAVDAAGVPDYPAQIRFTPFELCFFVLGILAYRLWTWSGARVLSTRPAGVVALGLLILVTLAGRWPVGYTALPTLWMSLSLGLIFALGAGAAFSLTAQWRVDRWLGGLAYPFYLWHTLIIGVVYGAMLPLIPSPGASDLFRLGVISNTATVLLSILTFLAIEHPVARWREARFMPRRVRAVRAVRPMAAWSLGYRPAGIVHADLDRGRSGPPFGSRRAIQWYWPPE